MQLSGQSLLGNIRGDILGGITTGVVALPLALALGVASGAGAAAGLYSAIFTGTIAALFGGTPAQISGPTAGMTAILIGVFRTLGLNGLFAAMLLAGVLQMIFSMLRVGKYIYYLPQPVVSGFTNGIAALIFWNQFKDIFLPNGPMHTPIQMALAAGVVGLILIWPRITRSVPGSLAALIIGTAIVLFFQLPVKLLGAIPTGLPIPHWPLAGLDWSASMPIIKASIIVAMLGTIESLLASIVVDEMTATRHHSDREIFGQGLANLIAPIFGGLAGTGAIVRSAVNVRAGGRTPLSALTHSALILAVTLGLGRYAALIPVPVLWGILLATAVGMVEWHSIRDLRRAPKSDSIVVVTTTLLTVIEDLVTGVGAGMLLSFIMFTLRMSRSGIEQERHGKAIVVRVEGPLFFGVAKNFLNMVESLPPGSQQIWDLSQVPTIDSTGAVMLRKAKKEVDRRGGIVLLAGLRRQPARVLERLHVLAEWQEQPIWPTPQEALAAAAHAPGGQSDEHSDGIQ